MTQPFIIYALPRSRTCWLSHLLTYGDWKCLHDPLAHSQPEGIACRLKMPNTGVVDTGLVRYWHRMRGAVPEAKIICIHRDPLEVRDSLVKIGLQHPFTDLWRALQEVSKEPDVLNIEYESLARRDVCKKLMRFCLDECDPDWVHGKMKANIQINPEYIHAKLCTTRQGA